LLKSEAFFLASISPTIPFPSGDFDKAALTNTFTSMRVFFCFLIFLFTACGVTSQLQNEAKSPTFKRGEYSYTTLIFNDTIIYARTFSDMGGMRSENFLVSNWRAVNDTTLELYNPRRGWFGTTRYFYIDKVSADIQLLIPYESIHHYEETLRVQLHGAVKKKPYNPNEEDMMLIQGDSARFYPQLMADHYEGVLHPYIQKLNDLGIYRGRGF
jgi:hypothetical protein